MSNFSPVPELTVADIESTLKDSILIVPAVSAGNVPQLTADLLIYTLGLKLVGRLDDTYVYPFIGPRDGPEGSDLSGISTALEGKFKIISIKNCNCI